MHQTIRIIAMIFPAILALVFFAISGRSLRERLLFFLTSLFLLFGIESLFLPALAETIAWISPIHRLLPDHKDMYFSLTSIIRITGLAILGVPFLLWLKRPFLPAA